MLVHNVGFKKIYFLAEEEKWENCIRRKKNVRKLHTKIYCKICTDLLVKLSRNKWTFLTQMRT